MSVLLRDDKYGINLDTDAIQNIKHLFGDMIVCVCIGANKSGKSFLMSQIHNKVNNQSHKNYSFEIDHENSFKTPCMLYKTSKLVINKEEFNLLLIECEVFILKQILKLIFFLKLLK